MSGTQPNQTQTASPKSELTSLVVWPAVLILIMAVLATIAPPRIAPRTQIHFMGMAGGWAISFLATFIWWIFLSRVRGIMRFIPVILAMAIVAVTISFYPDGMMALRWLLAALAITIVWCTAGVLGKFFGRSGNIATVVIALLIGLGLSFAIRIDATTAELFPEVSWRWQPTSEQLAMADRKPKAALGKGGVEQAMVATPNDWPQFRGINQDSKVTGVNIRTDWDKNPPKEIWRKRVGPSWGAVTIVGDLLFTQEQRGPNEAVTCLKAATGDELWSYETAARFDEAISGVGPRGTPTFSNGFIYAFGATGKLTKLAAHTGEKKWEVDVTSATSSKPPDQFWGMASSPFVINDLVVVFISGGKGKGTAAFRVDDGSLAWVDGDGRHGYSTVHKATIAGVDQLLSVSDLGIEAHDPKTGQVIWTYSWLMKANRSTQPILLGNDELILGTGYAQGSQRVKISKNGNDWKAEKVWESKKLKPYYNDAVLHKGLIYGFDDKAFCCIDSQTGQPKWNAGSVYGLGQVLLVADQNLLVVQAESGYVALVETNGEEFVQLAKIPAMSRKSWNHPVICKGKLYVRNSEEIVCFDVK